MTKVTLLGYTSNKCVVARGVFDAKDHHNAGQKGSQEVI